MQLKFISILSLFIFAFSFSQEKQAEIKFEEKLIDYGEIEFDSDGKNLILNVILTITSNFSM